MKTSSHKHRKNTTEVRARLHRKNRAKKRGNDVSVSDSDDDRRSNSSVSYSSSESEDGFRNKRSNIRGDSKKIRKKSRRSPSHEARVRVRVSPTHRSRKKLSSKKRSATGSESRKKSVKRKQGIKRSRRDVSGSSPSSYSCSTCSDSSSGGGDIKFERSKKSEGKTQRGRSDRGERTKRRIRDRSRSRSCSSCSECSKRSHRRSRSVTVSKKSKEIERRERVKDENKAEIIQAYDDCPSSRSNDSYEGGRKRESGLDHTQHISEKKRRIDVNGAAYNRDKVDTKQEEKAHAKQEELFSKITMGVSGDDEARCDRNDSCSTKTLMAMKNEVSGKVGGSEIDDLESLLRQKALENFAKFRNGLHVNSKSDEKDGSGVSKQAMGKAESTQIGSRGGAGGKAGAMQVAQNVRTVGISADGKSTNSLEGDEKDRSRVPKQAMGRVESTQVGSRERAGGKAVAMQVAPNLKTGGISANGKYTSSLERDGAILEGRYRNESMTKLVINPSTNPGGLPPNRISIASNPTRANIKNVDIHKSMAGASTFRQDSSADNPNLHEGRYRNKSTTILVTNPSTNPGVLPPSRISVASNPTRTSIKNVDINKSIAGASTFSQDSSANNSNVIVSGIRRHVDHVKPKIVEDHTNCDSAPCSSEKQNILMQAPTSQDSSNKRLSEHTSVTKTSPDNKVSEIPNTTPGSSNMHGAEVNKGDESAPMDSSSLNPGTGHHVSNEPKAEAQSGSQFEQKTMSVMRGGEMVQVSYKVYIPKKGPALARRQLQR
ncbi:uncharacterized protein LOC143892866 [Tasmannia lanceolata]|uniref:uncharacterized protein LOC143892866 n=1 Tax=Tasmannia lanceolata TaxID=3420 RepID=UPI004063C9DB